jgi:uncharacterized protein involved in exopolysaccharide biosynthesis
MSNDKNILENNNGIIEFIEKAAPYIRIISKNRKKLFIINGIIAFLSVLILVFFVKNYYDSTIIILPDYGGNSLIGSLSSLAAVAGISVGETEPTLIYQKLLEGETVLEPVIYQKYETKEYSHPVNLIEYYEIELDKTNESDPLFLQERDKFLQMIKIFGEQILTTELDRTTNILTFNIRTNEQILSSEIANNLSNSLDQYVRTKRKSNAIEQRIYIEKRTDQVKDSLNLMEESLKIFREQNRIVTSPQLLLEQSRLLRSIEILQTVYIELTKEMELIKLEEVKDAPIINIREKAGIPIMKAGPKRSIYMLFIMLFSIIISTGWVIYRNKIVYYYKFGINKIGIDH